MSPSAGDKPIRIYQLKITLLYIRPPIWRRIQVPGDSNLAKLHHYSQAAMGWYDCHLRCDRGHRSTASRTRPG